MNARGKRYNAFGFALIEVFLVLLVIGAVIGIGWYIYFGKIAATNNSLAPAKSQYSGGQTLVGYVAYNPQKFRSVSKLKFPAATVKSGDSNVVIAQGTLLSSNESGLYLYDLTTNKSYKLTSGGGDPRIMSDHFIIYGFDEGEGNQKQLGAKLLDLQTGKTTVVYSDTRANAPGTSCCSVSPDGFKAAIVHKRKISVWDIRTRDITDYPVTLDPIGSGLPTGEDAPYTVEMSYAKPVWQDNDTLVFADKPAVQHLKDANPTVDTTIYRLDTRSGNATEIPTPDSGIYNIWVSHGQPYILSSVGGSESISKVGSSPNDSPELVYRAGAYEALQLSPSGSQVIISGLALSQDHILRSYDVTTKETKDLAYLPPHANSKTTQPLARGWLSENHMILEINDTSYPAPHSYIGVLNIATGALEQYVELK